MWLHAQGLDQIVVERLRPGGKAQAAADLSEWEAVVDAAEHPVDEVTIAVVGKYVDHQDAYKSLAEALKHGGLRQRTKVQAEVAGIQRGREATATSALEGVDGILVPGGFGDRGFEGKVLTAQLRARARRAVLRHLLRHAGGGGRFRPPRRRPGRRQQHRERQASAASGDRPDHRMAHRHRRSRAPQTRTATWAAPCAWACRTQRLKPGTLARELYGKDVVGERHRHRYEFNNRYRTQLEDAGLVISRQVDGRPAGGDGRAAAATAPVVPGLPGAPGVPVHAARRPPAVHRLHPRRARAQGRRQARPVDAC